MTFENFYGKFNQTEYQGNEPYAMALYIQAVHESDNFRSNLSTNYNNLFGMKVATVRKQNRDGEISTKNGDFAIYGSPMLSIMDRIALDVYNRVNPPKDLDSIVSYFIEVQGRGYAEVQSPSYVSRLQSTANRLIDAGELSDLEGLDEEQSTGISNVISLGLFSVSKTVLFYVIGIIAGYVLYRRFIR